MAGDHSWAGRYVSRLLFIAARRLWRKGGVVSSPIAYRLRKQAACYAENRIRSPDKRVRLPNLLTPKDLFGENQEIRKRLRPNGLLTKFEFGRRHNGRN